MRTTPEDKEATEALPATQPEADEYPFSTTWDTHLATCWTLDKDNLVPSCMGRTSKQI